MSEINDGGPAFPIDERTEHQHGTIPTLIPSQPGMSLRDYFAGQALVGLLHRGWAELCVGNREASYAQQAYQIADAIIAQRAL